MGEARRRRQQLGELYGTPEGSNRKLIAYKGFSQAEVDQKILGRINSAKNAGQRVILFGTIAARPFASAAGMPWLHEIARGAPLPLAFAYDPAIAERGGPILRSEQCEGAICIIGAGYQQWLASALLASANE